MIIAVVVIVLIVLYTIATYNGLVKSKNKCLAAWAQIDVQLKRRADMIPNIVETVKGYAKHEKETLEGAIRARNSYVTASTPEEQLKNADEINSLTGGSNPQEMLWRNGKDATAYSLSRLMMLQESYPDLKANTNFMSLQNDLKETEDKISYARQFYNDDVKQYVNKLEMFPSNIIASMFHFEKMNFFEVDEASKEVPKVQF